MSAGGTSLMVFMGAVGVLCNISNNGEIKHNFKISVFKHVDVKQNKKFLKGVN